MDDLNDSLSPRQPAQKRVKELEDDFTEEQSILELTMNELRWVIHTLSADIEKRKLAKTGVHPLDECLTKIQSSLKQINKASKQQKNCKSMINEMTSSVIDKFTAILAEKEKVIGNLNVEISNLKSQSTRKTDDKHEDLQREKPQHSYAQVATRGRPTSIRRAHDRSKSRKAMNAERAVKAKATNPPVAFYMNSNGEDSTHAKEALWKTVTKKTRTPKINLITTSSGRILVKPINKESEDILRNIANKKPGTLIEDLPRRPRIIIKHLDSSTSASELPSMIASQNPDLGLSTVVADDAIFPIFKRGKRDLPTVNWVCEVIPNLYHKIIKQTLYVGFYRCHVSAFENVTQCYKCLQFGHPSTKCSKETVVCAHCSAPGHKRTDCQHLSKDPVCVNCKGKHQATDPTCSRKSITLANLQTRTDYGSQTVEDNLDEDPEMEI